MRRYKLRILNAFFIYVLVVLVTGLVFYNFLKINSFYFIVSSFLIISTVFTVILTWYFEKMISDIKIQLKELVRFVEKGEPCIIEDPLFEDLYNEVLLKSEELRQLISDFTDTNNFVKTRISDVIYSFDELIDDYKEFSFKFNEMVTFISSISTKELDTGIEEKLQSFIYLTTEINKFREKLLDLVEKVKDIVNDYIVRTSEDIKNSNLIIKGFLSFSENLVLNIDKIILFFNNIDSHSNRLIEEIGKMEKHKSHLIERIETIRDNFDKEKEIFDEIIGLNRTTNDTFYQVKTILLELSNLNKKASLMSLNALIYASETSKDDKKFVTVAKELKKLVDDIEKKRVTVDSFFSNMMRNNNYVAKLLSDYEKVNVKNRVELTRIATDIDHFNHHTKMIKQSNYKMAEPVEENITLLNSIKEGIVNHSSSIKQVLIVFKDYLAKLDKAEKDRESFDSLVVSTAGLLDYINNTLPEITDYITGLLKSLEEFSKDLSEANSVIENFNHDKAVREFGVMLDDLQHKRLANLKNSLVLLEKAKNIKKIL